MNDFKNRTHNEILKHAPANNVDSKHTKIKKVEKEDLASNENKE